MQLDMALWADLACVGREVPPAVQDQTWTQDRSWDQSRTGRGNPLFVPQKPNIHHGFQSLHSSCIPRRPLCKRLGREQRVGGFLGSLGKCD